MRAMMSKLKLTGERVRPPVCISRKANSLRQINRSGVFSFTVSFSFRHHRPHLVQSLLRSDSTADDEIIGIVTMYAFQRSSCPSFFHPSTNRRMYRLLNKRTDRRPLWSTSTFVPIARTPMFVPTLVGFSTGASSTS